MKARFTLEKGTKSLRRYLELAPKGHWHAPRACLHHATSIPAKGASDNVSNMERRNPGFCAESLRIFERGVEELQLYENCFGEEESEPL
jgi:hypothetical protein